MICTYHMPRPKVEDGTLRRLNLWLSKEKITDKIAGHKNSGITVDDAINILLDKVGAEREKEDFSLLSD